MNIHTRKSLFHPVSPVQGRNNYLLLYIIEEDGSVRERVFLNIIDPAEREKIILIHYLRFTVKHFFTQEIGVNVLSRDNPWDFKIELSTNKQFNIEITSIADNDWHFKVTKDRELLNLCQSLKIISLRKLKKIHTLFPDDNIESILLKHKNLPLDKEVINPLFNKTVLPLSRISNATIALDEKIKNAIAKKVEKKHTEKENTILIIDNRTSIHDLPDYYAAVDKLESYIRELPFPEIWFYTGFYSDDDGNNADYMFSPIKTTVEQEEILLELSKKANVNGEIFW